MHLDELRTILLSERETGRLIQIPQDLFESTRNELDQLFSDVYAQEDPFSDKVRILIERVSSIRETLQDLFAIRSEKIQTLARTQEEGQYFNREELKRMLPHEREMFDSIVMAIERCRCALISHSQGGAELHPAWRGEPKEPCEAAQQEQAASLHYVLTRVLADMEPFMGVDGRIYQIQKEDIVTLPERNAEVLCERNIVLNINPGK